MRRLVFGAVGLIVVVLAALTIRQVTFWENTTRLYEHTLAVTHGNSSVLYMVAIHNLDEATNAEE